MSILIIVFSCGPVAHSSESKLDDSEQIPAETKAEQLETSRASILAYLKQKDSANKPRVIHMLVPLCDNENQGIVPVNDRLGDGQNLNTNLYWGAGYGIRTFFKKSTNWQLETISEGPKSAVLQVLVFKHTIKNAYLVAHAYAGDQMEECLRDYWNMLEGDHKYVGAAGQLYIGSQEADLVIFNGHNGLMDVPAYPSLNQDDRRKDAVAIACVSDSYFTPHFRNAGGYPLLMTTNFMAPEGYVSHAVIEGWLNDKSPAEIRKMCGAAYHKYQKCGIHGATNLFTTGWE